MPTYLFSETLSLALRGLCSAVCGPFNTLVCYARTLLFSGFADSWSWVTGFGHMWPGDISTL